MATLGGWRDMYSDPHKDPERFKRERSGFWTRHYDHYGQVESWTCDKRKLNDKVAEAMLSRGFAEHVQQHGIRRVLDEMFGEGTGEAFTYKTENEFLRMDFSKELVHDRQYPAYGKAYDQMKENTRRQQKGMGYYNGIFGALGGGTTSTNTIASGTSATTQGSQWIQNTVRDEIKQQAKRLVKRTVDPAPKPERPLVRNTPFVHGGDSLLKTLQRDFDYWAKPQMEILHG